MFIRLPARRHGWIAPSSGSSMSGTTSASSKIIFWPRPWQTGHAPAGALKEKCFGVGGSKLLPVAGEHILFECKVSVQISDFRFPISDCAGAASATLDFGLWTLDSSG